MQRSSASSPSSRTLPNVRLKVAVAPPGDEIYTHPGLGDGTTPSTGTREFSLRDPDGYYGTISALAAA